MSNTGVTTGLTSSGWRTYTPILRGFNATGAAITQPTIGNGSSVGRYLRMSNGLVICQIQIVFGSTSTFGSAEHMWGISLPFPANRSSGGADLPIGNGWAWKGSASNPQLNMPIVPTLMDPLFPDGNRSNEDYYVQAFLAWNIAMGTGSIATSATSTTVTHNLGSTPTAYDIEITATNNPSTAPRLIYVDTITSTQFNVNVGASSATTGLTFAWKVREEPNGSSTLDLLMNSLRPWKWGKALDGTTDEVGHQISMQLYYEARR